MSYQIRLLGVRKQYKATQNADNIHQLLITVFKLKSFEEKIFSVCPTWLSLSLYKWLILMKVKMIKQDYI